MNPRDLVLRPVRAGLRWAAVFCFPAAFLGLAIAALVNPTASGDDLAVLVAVPLLVFVLILRAITIWHPYAPQSEKALQEGRRLLKEALREFPWLRPIMMSSAALMWAIGSLLATPIYWLLGLDTALILYGFAWAGILFGVGVALFFLALYRIGSTLPAALIRATFAQAFGEPLARATTFMLSALRA